MQPSGSFSQLRTGRPRPADIISPHRISSSESQPWPSPSFNASHGASSHVQGGMMQIDADPMRPSSKLLGLRSPISIDGLPPTPVTAGLKLSPLTFRTDSGLASKSNDPTQGVIGSQNRTKLPGLSAMIRTTALDSPPLSARHVVSTSHDRDDSGDSNPSDKEILTEEVEEHAVPTSCPADVAAPRTSATGVFAGVQAEWTRPGNNRSLSDVALPRAPRVGYAPLPSGPSASWATSSHNQAGSSDEAVRARRWMDMPRDDGVKGLGLSLSASTSSVPSRGSPTDLTPRLGAFSMNSPSATPTVGAMPHFARHIPGAPNLHASSGRFEDLTPTSPPSASFAGARWSTDLRFEGQPHTAPEPSAPSWTPRAVRAAEMERERTVCIEGGMPRGQGLHGLGVRFMLPPVSASIDPAFSRVASQAPLRDVMAEPDEPLSSKGSTLKKSPSATALSRRSTGLTPHIEKTRLTPYNAGVRPKQGTAGSPSARAGSSGGVEVEGAEDSPALRTQSKARSDLLRESALAAAASLPFEGFSGSTAAAAGPTASPTKSSSRSALTSDEAMELAATAPSAMNTRSSSSPQGRKRSFEEPELQATEVKPVLASGKADLSPWGVFDLSSPSEGNTWTPLGPPVACANGKGVLGSTNSNIGRSVGNAASSSGKGKARAVDASQPGKKSSSKKVRRGAGRGEDKENASSESGDSTSAHPRSRSASQGRRVPSGAKDVFGSATNSPALNTPGMAPARRFVGIR